MVRGAFRKYLTSGTEKPSAVERTFLMLLKSRSSCPVNIIPSGDWMTENSPA